MKGVDKELEFSCPQCTRIRVHNHRTRWAPFIENTMAVVPLSWYFTARLVNTAQDRPGSGQSYCPSTTFGEAEVLNVLSWSG
jgi:hypothetical protein